MRKTRSTDEAPDARALWLDAATASGIAVLNLLSPLRRLVFASDADRYYLPDYEAPALVAGLALLLIGSATGFVAIRMVRRSHRAIRAIAGVLLVLGLINPLNLARLALGIRVSNALRPLQGDFVARFVVLLIALATIGVAVRYHAAVLRLARLVFVIFSPFALLTVIRLLIQISLPQANAALVPEGSIDHTTHAAPIQRGHASVILIVMDELDFRLVFAERPSYLKLPEVDRLISEAVVFTDVEQLGLDTLEAIPSLLLGEVVLDARVVDHRTLLVQRASTGEYESFSSLRNVFHDVRELGARLSVIGYYHPYCRLFPNLFDECVWTTNSEPFYVGGEKDFLGRLGLGLGAALVGVVPDNYRIGRIWNYRRVLEITKRLVEFGRSNLVFLHLQLPHKPYIFDADSSRFTVSKMSEMAYFDNLVLMDHFFTELRMRLEETGRWRQTSIVLTSDHAWRRSDWFDGVKDPRIPLVVRLAGQSEPVVYDNRFSAESVRPLVVGLMSERLRTTSDLLGWLGSLERVD